MIRPAEAGDAEAIRRLWETCFPDEGGFNGYFFQHFFRLEHTLLLTESGTISAMAQMLPYRLRTGAKTHEITYIYGACTAPAYRRKGCMSRLLEASFALDRKNGRAATALIPAEKWLFDFYRPFGYEPFFYIGSRRLVRDERIDAERPRRLTEKDIPCLAAFYEREAPACRIVRDEDEWARQLTMFDEIAAGAYGWFDGDALRAYAFCWQDNAQEVFGLTAAREQGLLLALGQDALSVTECGAGTALGCIKWYEKTEEKTGYMNLMLN